jgi:hypothetical protein
MTFVKKPIPGNTDDWTRLNQKEQERTSYLTEVYYKTEPAEYSSLI